MRPTGLAQFHRPNGHYANFHPQRDLPTEDPVSVGPTVRRFAVAASLAALFLIPTRITAQTGNTIDYARISIGVSAGVRAGAFLWDIPDQTIVPTANDPLHPPPNSVFHLHREVAAGPTFTACANFYANTRWGFTFEFAYLGLNLDDKCGVAAGSPVRQDIYPNFGSNGLRLSGTMVAGISSAPAQGFGIHLEVRETFITQEIVTSATPTQGLVPLSKAVWRGFPSILFGFDLMTTASATDELLQSGGHATQLARHDAVP